MNACLLFGVASLLAGYELQRRIAAAAWACSVLLPLCLTPYWLASGAFAGDAFVWIKLYSIVAIASWIVAMRATAIGDRRWSHGVLVLLAVVNILEAVVKGACGSPAQRLNAAAGLVLAGTFVCAGKSIRVDAAGQRDVSIELPWPWIAGYTAWNWVFVLGNYPQYALPQLAVLVAPLLAAAFHPSRWGQARVLTFGLALPAVFTFPEFFRW